MDAHGLPVAGSVEQQRLRPALQLDATTLEGSLLERHADRLRAWGWELREARDALTAVGAPSSVRLVVDAQPLVQSVALGASALFEYAQALDATAGRSIMPPPAVLRVLASKACRRAIMFGDTLDRVQCQDVLSRLAQCATRRSQRAHIHHCH